MFNIKNIFNGYKSYIIGGLIALIGLLASVGVIEGETAQELITILLGLLGISLRHAISKLGQKC